MFLDAEVVVQVDSLAAEKDGPELPGLWCAVPGHAPQDRRTLRLAGCSRNAAWGVLPSSDVSCGVLVNGDGVFALQGRVLRSRDSGNGFRRGEPVEILRMTPSRGPVEG